MEAHNIESAESNIAAFEPFRAQLSELRQHNESVVFNYTDPKGNKEARSHIYKLRRTKTAVDQARKDAGKDALDYKRRVDTEGKEIIAEIETMIAVHQAPLDEIEQREKDRVENIHRKIGEIAEVAMVVGGMHSSQMQEKLETLELIAIDDSFCEFKQEALEAKDKYCSDLRALIAEAKRLEAERAELERLQAAEIERQRQEREAQIAREAEERATRQAEELAAKKEREHQAAIERAEREKAEAEAAAKQAKADAERRQAEAVEAERQRIASEQAAADAAAEKKAANKRHQAKINREALADLVALGHTEDQAKALIEAIVRGQIRNVQINY